MRRVLVLCWLLVVLPAGGCASGNTDAIDGGSVEAPVVDQRPGARDRAVDGPAGDRLLLPDLPPPGDGPLPDLPPADTQPWPDLQPAPDLAVDSVPWPDLPPPDGPTGGEVCGNTQDDDGDGKIDCVDPDCWPVAPCVSATRTLVLHEIHPGTPDYVVLRNASNSARNTAGFVLEMHGISVETFTLPSKVLSPGQIVAIFENTTGQAGDINTGGNIPFYNAVTGTSNAALLKSPAGTVIDYVGIGVGLPGLPSGAAQAGGPVSYTGFDAATTSHYRAGMTGAWPTFQASDWVAFTKSR